MSGRVQDQKLHPSPEKELQSSDKAFLFQHGQHEQQQQHEQLASPHSPCKRHHGQRQTHANKWEPSEEEIRSLAMRDFDVIGVLGVGTYGVVKLAKHVASGASVALKVLSKEHVVSMRQEKHILRERLVHLQLKHAFIARLYGTFQDEDCLYLVIEYLPGGELWSLVYSDFDNNNDGEGEDNSSSKREHERVATDAARNDAAALAASAIEADRNADQEQDDKPGHAAERSQQTPLSAASGAAEKDTEARLSTPTDTERVADALASPPAPLLLLTSKLTLNLVGTDEPPAPPLTHEQHQQDQQQGSASPRRRRRLSSASGTARPLSPVRGAIRLDAKSRGLLRNSHGGLKEDHAVFYLACILRALEYLHARDLLYRDLKLENLVLDRSGYPKVLDFGFAKQNAAGKAERNMTLCGSMDYMAPEILLHEPHDQRVDIWSFGVIMYELLLGKTPFYHENARELGRKITTEPVVFPNDFEEEHPDACDLIAKLLVKTPAERLGSMQELKTHAFFRRAFPDADAWEALERKERAAPFAPKLAGPFDTSFFQTIDDATQDELEDFVLQPYFEDGSHIFRAF